MDAGVAALRIRSAAADLPDVVRAPVERELTHLEEAGPLAPDRAESMAWIDAALSLPWSSAPRPIPDLGLVRAALERDHLGQARGKLRILEALASARLRADGRIPALGLVGPPGVGKSALPQTLAQALGRPLVRLSLANLRSEDDLLGSSRLIFGGRPGRLLDAIRAVGVLDPVIVLEGLDEFAAGYDGDAAAALLPLLDPAQASRFTDRWLGLPLNLAGAWVMATAYGTEGLPLDVHDRLHVVTLRGYVDAEKRHVARDHLLPRLAAQAGLAASDVDLSDETLQALIDGWTFESGVRDLERSLLALLRRLALRRADGEPGRFRVEAADLPSILGPRPHRPDRVERMGLPGVAMGLAWTPSGGQVLFIEASAIPGRGTLKLTGSLGDVMKESAEAALTWLREHTPSHARLPELDVHIHVPEGATPKDGPSAGLVLLVAVASALSGRVARHDLALTGEITLRGLVLAVGGVREKVLAAQRAGVKAVILPKGNAEDLSEVPADLLAGLEVYLVERIEEALEQALGGSEGTPHRSRPVVPPAKARAKARAHPVRTPRGRRTRGDVRASAAQTGTKRRPRRGRR